MDEPVPETRSLQEAIEAIRALTDDEILRIEKAARILTLVHRRQDPKELINEAIVRIAEGRRKWPKSISFLLFIKGVMKSVAGHEAEREASTVRLDVGSGTESVHLELAAELSVSTRPDDDMDKQLQKLREHFKTDETVMVVLAGWSDRMKKAEILECGLEGNDYDAAVKRIYRYVDSLPKRGLND